jgi:GDP-4-dehydro-6-deoxy-D-mannose reductase
VDFNDLPLKEDSKLNPISPCAVARVSQELISTIYTNGYGVDIVKTRSFNHIGPGQSSNFVISSFARQIVERKLGLVEGPIKVGNLEVIRDFIDVRDVVSAYWNVLWKGKAGEVYNVCSGTGFSINQILDKMIKISGVNCSVEVQNDLIRPIDNPIIIGDNSKIFRDCNWKPNYLIEDSLVDIMNYWNENLVNYKRLNY